jgi:hypothetical protein
MMESRRCVVCDIIIPEARIKILPNTRTCVAHSTTGAKRGVPMMFGEKDHTWTDMVIMESDEYERYEKQQNQTISFDILDKTEMNSDDDDVSEWDNTLLDGLKNL